MVETRAGVAVREPLDSLAAWDRLREDYPAVSSGLPHDLVLALSTVDQGRTKQAAAVRDADVPLEDLLDALSLVSTARRQLDGAELALMDAARARGGTWRLIAQAQQLASEQAVQQRHGRMTRARTER